MKYLILSADEQDTIPYTLLVPVDPSSLAKLSRWIQAGYAAITREPLCSGVTFQVTDELPCVLCRQDELGIADPEYHDDYIHASDLAGEVVDERQLEHLAENRIPHYWIQMVYERGVGGSQDQIRFEIGTNEEEENLYTSGFLIKEFADLHGHLQAHGQEPFRLAGDDLLKAVRNVLFPNGDLNHQCDFDDLWEVINLLTPHP